jgi:hypothetical protein
MIIQPGYAFPIFKKNHKGLDLPPEIYRYKTQHLELARAQSVKEYSLEMCFLELYRELAAFGFDPITGEVFRSRFKYWGCYTMQIITQIFLEGGVDAVAEAKSLVEYTNDVKTLKIFCTLITCSLNKFVDRSNYPPQPPPPPREPRKIGKRP